MCDESDTWWSQTFSVANISPRVQIIALSETTLKIRLDKENREQWGKISKVKKSDLKADLDANWSDYEEDEEDFDGVEYEGVHPDDFDESEHTVIDTEAIIDENFVFS